jgi:hypothetical protein
MSASAGFDSSRYELYDPNAPEVPRPAATSPRTTVHWHGERSVFAARNELVRGLIPADEIILIGGQSGAGKTFVAIDLARALACGGTFFGHQVRDPGGTLFLLAEGVGTIAERLEAVRIEGGFTSPMPIAWHSLSGSLLNEADLKAVTAHCKSVAEEMPKRHGVPLKLIVVDTVAAAFAMQDENDAASATKAMRVLQGLHVATGALVAGVAHYGKTAETGIRGSSAFTASADAILAVHADREPMSGRVLSRSVSLTKSRWRDTGWQSGFELKGVRLGLDDEGEDVWAATVLPTALPHAKAGADRGWSRSLRLFRDAVVEAIGTHGKDRLVGGNGAKVRAVDIEDMRLIFYARYATGEGVGDVSAKAKRSALRNGLSAAIRQRLMVSETVNGTEWVWLP